MGLPPGKHWCYRRDRTDTGSVKARETFMPQSSPKATKKATPPAMARASWPLADLNA